MVDTYEVLLISENTGQHFNISAYNVNNGQTITSFKGGTSQANTLCIYDDEYILSSIPKKSVIQVYEICRKQQQVLKLVVPGVVSSLCVSNDNSMLAAGVAEKLLVWELAGGELLAVLSRHYQAITCLSFSFDNSYIASSGEDGIVSVWDLSDVWDIETSEQNDALEPYHSWNCHVLAVSNVRFGARYRLYSSSLDNTVRIHDIPTKQTIVTLVFSAGVSCFVVGSGESFLFAGCTDGTIHEVNLLSCEKQLNQELLHSEINSNSDNQNIISAHDKPVTCLTCSMDDSFIVSGSADNTVKFWDVLSHQCVRTIKCSGAVSNARLVTASPGFVGTSTKPSQVFPKLSRQVGSSKSIVEKQFRIGSHEVWDDIDEDHLIETLALHEVSETNPMGKIQDLMAENHALVEANKRLTNFVMKNIPK